MKGPWVLLAVVALLTTSCRTTFSSRLVQNPEAAIERLRNGGGLKQEVDALALPVIEQGRADGLAVGVLTPEGTAFFGYGNTGRGSSVPAVNTVFEVGSLSKLFVSAVLAGLVEQGQMRYEERVRDILPPNAKARKEIGELTVYELATHTAGFARQPATFNQLIHFMYYLFTGHNLYSYIDKDFLYRYVRTCRLPPREKREYVYSNIGLGLLAHLIELKTGKTVPRLVEEQVTKPLGMRDTVYELNEEQGSRLATGHAGGQPRFVPRHTPLAPWDLGEIMNPTAGLYSTVEDLLKFARANLGLSRQSTDELLLSTQQAQLHLPQEDVAFGWLLNHIDKPQCTIIYKHGMVAGYNAYIGMNRETKVAVVVLCNTFSWTDEIGHNLVLRLSGARLAEQAAVRGGPNERYAGGDPRDRGSY